MKTAMDVTEMKTVSTCNFICKVNEKFPSSDFILPGLVSIGESDKIYLYL